jgi:uncharacterized protein
MTEAAGQAEGPAISEDPPVAENPPVAEVSPSPASPPAAKNTREEGFDLARAVAIVLMVLVNFQLMLARGPAPTDGPASLLLRWIVHVPSGRSSSLFVVLAGVGITLLTRTARTTGDRKEWRVAVRTLLLRSVFLLFAGLTLILVWSIDILHFYAAYLFLATLFLIWLPDRALLVVYALIVSAGVAIELAFPEIPEIPFRTPLGLLSDLFVSGVHPIFPWLAFVTYGLWLGRRDLSNVGLRRRIGLAAGLVVVAVELGSLLVSLVVISVPALSPLSSHLDLLATGWTPDPLYVISASGTATLVIVLAHEVVSHARLQQHRVAHTLTRAMIATGQLALSIYVTHAVIGVVIPRAIFGWNHGLPVEAVTAYWAAFCLSIIVLAAIYRRFLSRGPLEFVMRALTSWRLSSERAPTRAPTPTANTIPEPPRPLWLVVLALALVLLAIRVLGLPLSSSDTTAPVARMGQLSLLSQRSAHLLDLSAPSIVTLETHSGLDLYLELDALDAEGNATRVAEDDDGGPGTEARIARALSPGRYRITVRPYGATTGPYAVSVLLTEP